MQSFTDQNLTFIFNCSCGSKDFDRPICFKDLKGFYEGHFECSECKKEHDYTSKAFKRTYTQLELF